MALNARAFVLGDGRPVHASTTQAETSSVSHCLWLETHAFLWLMAGPGLRRMAGLRRMPGPGLRRMVGLRRVHSFDSWQALASTNLVAVSSLAA